MNTYIAPNYNGKVFLLWAKNRLGDPVQNHIHSHGWIGNLKQLKILNIPGDHFSLFDYKYIKSTAEAINQAIKYSFLDDQVLDWDKEKVTNIN